jgi:pimeloyl-ACP methyl ester carboxylesterase
MDFRGYGGGTLGSEQSRADNHCNDMLRVMHALGKPAVILCGLSFGSWIAASFAMRHPGRLVGLVFSSGCTGMSEAPESERAEFLRLRRRPMDDGKRPAEFASEVVSVIAGPEADQGTRRILHDAMASISVETYGDAVFCFAHPEEQLDFARIACPVLLMTGEHDRLARPGEIREVARRIHDASPRPDVRSEAIERAGHVCNLENPQRFNAVLEEFVRRLV